MTGDFLGFNGNTLTFRSTEQKEAGDEIDYNLCMPEGILLRRLTLNGIVENCRYVHGRGGAGYVLVMNVHNMTAEKQLILNAYMEYLKREDGLNKNSIDKKALLEVFDTLGEKLVELYEESVKLLNNLKGEGTIQ